MEITEKLEKTSKKNYTNGYTEVYVWGKDMNGQLGLGHKFCGKSYNIPKVCSYNLIIFQVACGENHSAFLTIRGHIYTIGSNEYGNLGIGNKSLKQSSTPCLVEDLSKHFCMEVSCGSGHSAAVMENGEVYTWGDGRYGALGNGSLENRYCPTRVVFDRSQQLLIAAVSCGKSHNLFLNDKGECLVVGSNEFGQLGTGKQDSELIPYKLNLSQKITQIAAGFTHSLFLMENSEILACGCNDQGQLGLGHKKNMFLPVQVVGLEDQKIFKIASGQHSAAINRKGQIFLWGQCVFGELLTPQKLSRIESAFVDISVGYNFGSAIDNNGVAWTWGNNSNGELGLGDQDQRTNPLPVVALKKRHVMQVACGNGFVLALGHNRKDNMKQQDQLLTTHDEKIDDVKNKRDRGRSSHSPVPNSGNFANNAVASLKTSVRQVNNSTEKSKVIKMQKGKGVYDKIYENLIDSQQSKISPDKNVFSEIKDNKNKHNLEHSQNKYQQQTTIQQQGQSNYQPNSNISAYLDQIKQLDNMLKKERDEKHKLQDYIINIKNCQKELQFGQGGLKDLSQNLVWQNDRFEQLTKSIEHYQQKIETFEREIINLNSQNSFLEEVLEEKDLKIKNLEEEQLQKDQEIQMLANNIKEIDQSIVQKNKELEHADQVIQQVNLQVKELENQYNNEIKKLIEQVQKEKQDSQEIIDRMNETVAQLKQNIEQLNNEKYNLELKTIEQKREIENQKIEYEKERGIRMRYEDQSNYDQKQKEELEQKNAESKQEIERLQEMVYQAEITQQKLEEQLENSNGENQRYLVEMENIQQELKQKDDYTNEVQKQNHKLTQMVQELQENNLKMTRFLHTEIDKKAEEFKVNTFKHLKISLDGSQKINNCLISQKQKFGETNEILPQQNDDEANDTFLSVAKMLGSNTNGGVINFDATQGVQNGQIGLNSEFDLENGGVSIEDHSFPTFSEPRSTYKNLDTAHNIQIQGNPLTLDTKKYSIGNSCDANTEDDKEINVTPIQSQNIYSEYTQNQIQKTGVLKNSANAQKLLSLLDGLPNTLNQNNKGNINLTKENSSKKSTFDQSQNEQKMLRKSICQNEDNKGKLQVNQSSQYQQQYAALNVIENRFESFGKNSIESPNLKKNYKNSPQFIKQMNQNCDNQQIQWMNSVDNNNGYIEIDAVKEKLADMRKNKEALENKFIDIDNKLKNVVSDALSKKLQNIQIENPTKKLL